MPNRNQSQNSRPKRAPPCCRCNDINARCKFCACAKAGRACTCCLPAKHGKCSNGSVFSHGGVPTAMRAMVSSQPLPRSTARFLETQQLSSLQPFLRQLQASSASEHSSSLPSRPPPPPPPPQHHPTLEVRSRQNVITAPAPMIFPNPLHISTLDAFVPVRTTSLEGESQPATCCKCHSSGARCTSCKCCREERPYVNCYAGRRGKCTNIASSIPPVSSPHVNVSSRFAPLYFTHRIPGWLHSKSNFTQSQVKGRCP